jgi:uncharacterized SAM-binding protein YcdF (DUF218 family)
MLIINKQNLYNYLAYIKKPHKKIDTIYVFCGSLDEYLWRVDAAAEAFKRFSANEVILFDDRNLGPWVPELGRNLTFVERAQRRLIQKGIPNDDIVVLRAKILETWDEAKGLNNFIDRHPTTSLLIVTSPYHLRRAYWSVTQNLNKRHQVYTYAPEMVFNEGLSNTYTLIKESIKLNLYRILYR